MRFGRWTSLGLGLVLAMVPIGTLAGWADPFGEWHPSELRWNRLFQSVGDVHLLMRGISALGPGSVMWALIVALFFGGYPRLGARLAILTLIAHWLREVLALSLQSPRPYWLDTSLQTFGDVATKRATYGLPSGHAMVSAAFWFFLAAELRRGWAWIAALGLVFAICMSRIYLGVHFVTDVSLGTMLGAALAWGFRCAESRWTSALTSLQPRWGILLSMGVCVAMVALGWGVRAWVLTQPIPEAWAQNGLEARRAGTLGLLGGSLAGLAIGLYQARRPLWEALERGVPWSERLLRVGIAGGVGYGVSKLVQLPILKASLPSAEGPIRLAVLFSVATLQTALVWWGLPRFLDWVKRRSLSDGKDGSGPRPSH